MLPKDEVVHISKQFRAPAADVFDAWIKPAIVKQWLFVGPESEITAIDINDTAGGHFSIKERMNGIIIDHFGKYVEMERPGRLAFSLEVPLHFTGVTYVSIFITPLRRGCELRLVQTGVSPEKTMASWYLMLGKLEQVLKKEAAGATKSQKNNKAILHTC